MDNEPGGGIRVPLSYMQEHMWWLERIAPAPGFFNESLSHRFSSAVDPALLTDAIAHLTQRHESLRTTFPTRSGEPYQSIAPTAEVEVAVSDLASLPADERRRQLRRLKAADAEGGFDSAGGPLFRARLFRLGDEGGEVFFVFDHLVADPTAEAIFVSELDEVYASLSAGEPPSLARPALDYADFAVWQRRWMTEERLREYEEHWRSVLRGASPVRKVPYSGRLRDPSLPDRSDDFLSPVRLVFTVPSAVCEALRRLPRSSSYIVCTAAVAALVARSTGEPDTLLLTSVDGRDRAELAGILGLFGGTSLLRIDLRGDPPFEVALRRARASVLGVLEHQHFPLYPILRTLKQEGTDISEAAIPVAVHFFHAAHHRWAPGTSVVARPPEKEGLQEPELPEVSKPLEFRFYDDGSALWGELLYHGDYFDRGTAAQVVSDLKELLAAVLHDPMLRLSQLPVAV